VFIEAKNDDGGGGDNWTTGAISRAKLQSNHHYQQTNIQFFTGRCAMHIVVLTHKLTDTKYLNNLITQNNTNNKWCDISVLKPVCRVQVRRLHH